jgi:hypothetical protein
MTTTETLGVPPRHGSSAQMHYASTASPTAAATSRLGEHSSSFGMISLLMDQCYQNAAIEQRMHVGYTPEHGFLFLFLPFINYRYFVDNSWMIVY